MAASYTVAVSTGDGSVLNHPDQPAGPGVNLPATIGYADMAAIHTAMGPDTAFFECGGDSDAVLYRAGPTYLLAAFRSFPAQRLFTSFTPREEPDGSGGVLLRFVGKNARALTLEQVLEACGFAATGLFSDSINTAAEVVAANNAMNNTLKAYIVIARVV